MTRIKDKWLQVRVSEDEKILLKKLAEKYGMELSTYILFVAKRGQIVFDMDDYWKQSADKGVS